MGRWLSAMLVLLVWQTAPVSAGADEPVSPATPDTVRSLRDSAVKDRAYAGQSQARADAWRELAKRAQAEAERASDPEIRKMWQSDAERRLGYAAELEASVQRTRALADEKDARAARLEQAYQERYDSEGNRRPPPVPSPQPVPAAVTGAPAASPSPAGAPVPQEPAAGFDSAPCWKLSEADAVAVWRDTKDGSAFAIRPRNPDAPPEGQAFEGLSMSRAWEGEYHPADGCAQKRMTFRYRPHPEEMNPEAPLWARRAVAGRLEWVMELREGGTCGSHRLLGSWFPGEIAWRDDGEGRPDGAWVAGRGEARAFELRPDIVLEGDVAAAPSLVVGIQGQPDPFSHPIEVLIEGQRFDVLLTLPRELAKKAGTETRVRVTNLTHPDSTDLAVTTVPAALDRDYVLYQLASPATIADASDEGARDYTVIPLNPGDRISLDAENGDLIEVSWGEAAHRFTVYDTWIQLGIARHARRFEELRALYSAMLSAPEVSREMREQAHRRLRMVQNALTLIAQPEHLDPVKYAIGEFYLEAGRAHFGIDETGEAGLPMLQRAHVSWYGPEQQPNRFGFLWTSFAEEAVMGAISDTREAYRQQAKIDLAVAFTMGMYTATVGASGVGDLYTIGVGTDIYGRKVTGFERFMTAVGFTSGAILAKVGQGLIKEWMRPPDGRIGKPMIVEAEPVAVRSGPLPAALGGRAPRLAVRPAVGKPVPITCASKAARPAIEYPQPQAKPRIEYPESRPRPTIEYPGPKPTIQPARITVDESTGHYVALGYGPHARVVELSPQMLALRQEFGTCNCMATMYAKFKQTGQLTPQPEAMRMINRRGIVPADRYVEAGRSVHITNEEIERFVPAFNGESIDLRNGNPSLEALRAWDARGWVVKDVVRFPGDATNHAVIIDRFLTDAGGRIVGIGVFDSNVGGIVQMPVCEYAKIRVPLESQGVQLLRFARRPNIVVGPR